MKHFFAFCKRNRLFAALLAVELAVLCVLAAGLFGAPYKLTMTPDLFENPFPDIASNEGDHFQVWNQTNFQTSDPLDFPSAGQAVRSGAYEVTVQYFSCQTPDAPTFNMLNSAGTLSFSSAMVPSAVSADTLRLDDCHRTLTTRLWVSSGAQLNDLTATLHYNGQGQLYLSGFTSGTTIGTSGVQRCALLLETTGVQNALMNIVTVFLGISVGATTVASSFLTLNTLKIVVLGLLAFCFSTVGGLLGGKVMYIVTGGKVNPLIGSAGVSAVPMAARVSQKVGQKANPANFLLMHAMGPNVAGVIGSAIAAGFLLAVFK